MLAAKAKAGKKAAGKKGTKASGGGGFGAPAAKSGFGAGSSRGQSTPALSPAELLKRSMELYDEIKKSRALASADEEDEGGPSHTEYCITVRVDDTAGDGAESFADWVPVALIALKAGPNLNTINLMPQAVGACCREVLECGCQAYPQLRKLPRTAVQYAFEPVDAWTSHVYDGLQGRADRRKEAAAALGIDLSASASEIKRAHRKMMMELHPDRFANDEEGAANAQEQMLQVQQAYETLGGGQGSASGSRYAAIGGKARVDFSGPLSKEQLGALGKERLAQAMELDLGGWRAGVYPVDPAVTKEFAARNAMRGK